MKAFVALAFAAALLAAGCSKGDPPTQAQYAAVADGVCNAAHDELVTLTEEHQATKPDGGANQRYIRSKVIPRLRAMIGELRGIQRPENDGSYLDTVYADYEHALDILYSDPIGDSSDRAGNAVEERMKSYGMTACSTAADLEDGTSG